MRAKDFIKTNLCINHLDYINRIIDDLDPLRKNERETGDYFDRVLTADYRYEKSIIMQQSFIPNKGEIPKEYVVAVRKQLLEVIKDDKSFGYLYYFLRSRQNRIDGNNIECMPNKDEIELFIDFHDWNFFYNVENLPNQTLRAEAIEYFKTGAGKGFFEPLEFLNWVWKYTRYVNNNLSTADTVTTHLNNLQLTDKQRHILYCFIIKWAGGYPIGSSGQFKATYDKIAEEFFKYPENTPEKEFCTNKWYIDKCERFEADFTQETGDYERQIIKILEKRVEALEKENTRLEKNLNFRDSEYKQLKDNEIEKEKTEAGTAKVQTVALMEILKKAGISKTNADLTKIARFIAYLTGKNYSNIYEHVRTGNELTEHHTEEIKKANELLRNINAGISISKDNKK
jgi:hypothetical protein